MIRPVRPLVPALLLSAALVPPSVAQVTPEQEAAYERYLDLGSLIEGGVGTIGWRLYPMDSRARSRPNSETSPI